MSMTPGHANWNNLLRWLRLYYNFELDVRWFEPPHANCSCQVCFEDTVIGSMFSIIDKLDGCSWEDAKCIFEEHQKVLALLDPEWSRSVYS